MPTAEIADEAETRPAHHLAGEPSGDQADHQDDEERLVRKVHARHRSPIRQAWRNMTRGGGKDKRRAARIRRPPGPRPERTLRPARPPSRSPRRRRCTARRRRASARAPSAPPSSVTRMRAPEAPIGWPSAQAPPLTLTLSCGRPRSRIAAIATTAKASLISKRSTVAVRPAGLVEQLAHRADRRGGEQAGRVRRGSRGRRSRASGVRPRFSASLARISTSAAAPSEIELRIGRGDRAALAEGRLQGRDLVGPRLRRLLVGRDDRLALAAP